MFRDLRNDKNAFILYILICHYVDDQKPIEWRKSLPTYEVVPRNETTGDH